jgi:hypothetical protein
LAFPRLFYEEIDFVLTLDGIVGFVPVSFLGVFWLINGCPTKEINIQRGVYKVRGPFRTVPLLIGG